MMTPAERSSAQSLAVQKCHQKLTEYTVSFQSIAVAQWYYNATILVPSDVERLGGVAEILDGKPYLNVRMSAGLPKVG